MRKIIFLLFTICISAEVYSQEVSILSSDDGNPVVSATTIVKNLANGKEKILLSDRNGKINLSTIFNNQDSTANFHFPVSIIISCVGFEKKTDTIFYRQNKTYLLKPQTVQLNETVVTAQYAPGSTEKSIFKITVLDRKKIDAMAASNLRDVLSNETNIRLSQDQVLGSSMSMNGMSGENVKIMIDGVPVIGRQNGNIDLSQINLNDAERIEIVEGPLSVNYGTNALAGTINIITKKTQEKKIELSLNSYCESIGTFDFSGSSSFRFGADRISISGGRNYFDGWNSTDHFFPDFSKHIADSSRFQSWKPREQTFAGIQINHSFKKMMAGYKGELFKEKITNLGYPRASYMETAFDADYFTERINHAVYANGNITSDKYFNFIASLNNYRRIKNTFFKDLTTLEKELTTSPEDQDTSTFKQWMSRGSFSKSSDSTIINFETGYDIVYETATGKRIQNGSQHMGDYALFASSEITPLKNIVLRPGIRYGYNSSYTSPITPSFNIRIKTKNAILRMSYARGFRAPSLKELDFYFVNVNHHITGNPFLKAESSNNFIADLILKNIKGHKILNSELNLFYNEIHNLITLAQTATTDYSYINIGTYKTIGAGLKETLVLKNMKSNAGISYTGTYNQYAEKSFAGNFSFSPEVQFSVIYEPENLKYSIALFYKYQGRTPLFTEDATGNIQSGFINDYHIADISFTKYFWNKKLIIAAGMKNIFDVTNINSGISPGGVHEAGSNSMPVSTGRFIFTKIGFNFSK